MLARVVYRILLSWAAATLGLWLAGQMLRGVRLASFGDAVWAGALVGVLQWALSWPIFVSLGIGTLGLLAAHPVFGHPMVLAVAVGFLFWFLTRWIAAAIVILLASKLSARLEVRGFFDALITAFIIAIANVLVRYLL